MAPKSPAHRAADAPADATSGSATRSASASRGSDEHADRTNASARSAVVSRSRSIWAVRRGQLVNPCSRAIANCASWSRPNSPAASRRLASSLRNRRSGRAGSERIEPWSDMSILRLPWSVGRAGVDVIRMP